MPSLISVRSAVVYSSVSMSSDSTFDRTIYPYSVPAPTPNSRGITTGRSAITLGPLPQGIFLNRMGHQVRVDALKRAANNEERKMDIEKAANRLVDATGMGSQYQVLAVSGTGQAHLTPEQRWPFVEEQTTVAGH